MLAGSFNGLGWQQYAVGGVLGVPHCGSLGFGSEDNSGGEDEAGNIEYICMYSLINPTISQLLMMVFRISL